MSDHALTHLTIDDRIATITLDRPAKRNALSPALVTSLFDDLTACRSNDAVRAVRITAHGSVFSAGADLAYLQTLQHNTYEENLADSHHLRLLFELMDGFPKPLIAQVEGHAIAGGCGLATVCDFVFTVPAARFGYTEVRIGFVPALVMTFLLRRTDEATARRLLLTGELIDAHRAVELGLATEVVDPDAIDAHVLEFIQSLITSVSGDAFAMTKEMMRTVQTLDSTAAFDHAETVNARARATDDCKRGIAAFLAKERIRW